MSQHADRRWGPLVEGRSRHRWRRVLVAVLLLPALLLGIIGLGAVWASAQIPRTTVDGLSSQRSPLHVLVIGSDSRSELTPEERRELSTGSAEGERADTIFVMTIDGGRVATLAFPRDLWVTRCDGSTGRINAAIEIGGASCLVETVRSTSGIEVNHTLGVTFGGFRDVVDAVGGVELCLQAPIADRDAGIDLPAGCQRLAGADALGFVRVRKIDDDLHRIERQKTFLQALAAEVVDPGVLLNPARTIPLVREAGSAITADDGLGPLAMARIGWGLRGIARGTTIGHTVPATPRVTSAGAHVLDVDVVAAEALFAAFRTGEVLDEIPTTTVADDAPPDA